MDIKEKKLRLEKQLNLLDEIEELGIAKDISFIAETSVYCNGDINEMKIRRAFRKKHGKEKMDRYYINSRNCLAIIYMYTDLEIIFFRVGDIHKEVEKISKGKCKVVKSKSVRQKLYIECGITKED